MAAAGSAPGRPNRARTRDRRPSQTGRQGISARHRRTMRDSAGGIVRMHVREIRGSMCQDGIQGPERAVALERPTAGEHFVEHGAEREDVRASDRRPRRAPAPAPCIRRCRRRAIARIAAGWSCDGDAGGAESCSVARPKSRIFTRPSSARKMFSGFRSRCTMPRAWAAPSPRADLERDVERRVHRKRAARRARAQRLTFQALRHEVRRAAVIADVVDGQDVGVVECAGGARLVLERAHAFGRRSTDAAAAA